LNQVPETRDSLLIRLADSADHEAWSAFTAIYRPLIYRVARRRGLQDADAQDLVQQVFISLGKGIEQWLAGAKRARFRTWLHTVARNAVIDQLRSASRVVAAGGTTATMQLQEKTDARGNEADLEFEREYQRELFRWSAREVRDEFENPTWLAFWLSAVEGMPIPEVACELGKSVGAVYIARSRVIQRLREKITQYETEMEDGSIDSTAARS
jgi:RNA polymerase sigma-70 factor (ECF subfamily)